MERNLLAEIRQKEAEVVACVRRLFDPKQDPGRDTNLEFLRELTNELEVLEDMLLIERFQAKAAL